MDETTRDSGSLSSGASGAATGLRRDQSAGTPGDPWTTARLLAWLHEHFTRHHVEPARIIAEMLLSHVLGVERIALYMEPQRPATQEERDELRALVRRASAGEPAQFLIGWTTFYGRRIDVAPVTQIPQPCTEELVAYVVRALRSRDAGDAGEAEHAEAALMLADIGTGSGCIAIALAGAFPAAHLVATDINDEAAALAQGNVLRLHLGDRISVRTGDLCAPLGTDGPFHAIVSNPPYIPDAQWESGAVEEGVRTYVPARALRGGADGLAIIRRLISEAPPYLIPGGLLAVEVADVHAEDAAALVMESGRFASAEILRDEDGERRILGAVLKGATGPRPASAGEIPASDVQTGGLR